jgi:O-antigen/teichoic acid export membrane protein
MSIFKKYSYWIHSGKYTAIQKFSVLAMGIVSFMLLARILGPEGFGVWGLFLVISSITETARTALIRNAFIRFMNQTPEQEHGRLQSAALSLSLFISGILGLLFFALANPVAGWLNAPSLAGMLQWYAITLVVSVAFAHFEMLLNAKMDFKGVCWIYVVRQGLLVLLIGVCFALRIKITPFHLSIFYLISVVAGSLTGLVFSKPYLQWEFTSYKGWIKELWKFGKFVFGNNVCSQLFRSTDNFMTSRQFDPGVSAYYNACLRIGNLVDLPSQVLGDILFPKAAKFNSSDKAAVSHMYEKTVGAILIFSIPALLVLIIIPGPILYLLAGPKFLVAAPILRVTAFFGFTLPFLKQFGTIMDATGHPDTNFHVMLAAVIINIGANWTGLHFLGVIGAALGTATTYFIIFIITQIILYKKFGVKWTKVFQNTFSLYIELFNNGKRFLKMRGSIENNS